MKRIAISILLVLAGAAIGFGATSLLAGEDDPKGPDTTEAEAGTVRDLAAEVKARYDEASRMVKFCDRERNLYADTGGEGYQVCAKQEVEPITESADQLIEKSISDLKREVGPACLRALRRAEFQMGPGDLRLPENVVKRAAQTCQEEANS